MEYHDIKRQTVVEHVFYILCLVILYCIMVSLFQDTMDYHGFHGIPWYFTMIYLFQNTMLFTMEYDSIFS